jgi:succinyl-diaminopimelate desuccinylase
MSSIIDITAELVKISSQGGIDKNDNILDYIYKWSFKNELNVKYLYNKKNEKSAVLIQIVGKKPGRHFCFDSCADTAPYGDVSKWIYHPTSAIIKNSFMYGRGSSDSKVSIGIFLHIAKELNRQNCFNGQVDFLFDADEHTGNFSGIKSYLELLNGKKIDGAFIGYPGNDEIVVGARGFYRTEVVLYGDMKHSGSRKMPKSNAIVKAARLIDILDKFKFDGEEDILFSFGPKLTVTKIDGGDGFSVIPSKCILNIDIRLTPGFNLEIARKKLKEFIDTVDEKIPSDFKSDINEINYALPYKVDEDVVFINILKKNAEKEFKKNIKFSVCGPSNIGNLLYEYGINATCGFGVTYQGMHGIDERIELDSVEKVYRVYFETIKELLLMDM